MQRSNHLVALFAVSAALACCSAAPQSGRSARKPVRALRIAHVPYERLCPGECDERPVRRTKIPKRWLDEALRWIAHESHRIEGGCPEIVSEMYLVGVDARPATGVRTAKSREEVRQIAQNRKQRVRYLEVSDENSDTAFASIQGRVLSCTWGAEPGPEPEGDCTFVLYKTGKDSYSITETGCGMK